MRSKTYSLDATAVAIAATLSTAQGSNKDLTYTAVNPGVGGNAITITYSGGTDQLLSVSVVSTAITVHLATTGTSPTSTAAQILAAVLASGPATALVGVALKTGSSGIGIPVAFSATHLAGGVDASGSTIAGILDSQCLGFRVAWDAGVPSGANITVTNMGRTILDATKSDALEFYPVAEQSEDNGGTLITATYDAFTLHGDLTMSLDMSDAEDAVYDNAATLTVLFNPVVTTR